MRQHTLSKFVKLFLLLIVGTLFCAPAAFAADEICTSCGAAVSVSGNFTHRKEAPSLVVEGSGNRADAFREDVNGTDFTVSLARLPAGRYTITVSATETTANNPGERLFTVTSGDTVLAKDFDVFAAAGGARKVATFSGSVLHEDDALRGPLKISFVASKGNAKFNTIEVKNANGEVVVDLRAMELADAFSAGAVRVPDIKEPPIWRDPSKPLKARADDLIRRMSLAEKVAQLQECRSRDCASRLACL